MAALVFETGFLDKLSAALEAVLSSGGLDVRLVQSLEDAWLRLQRSGVLETRGILD